MTGLRPGILITGGAGLLAVNWAVATRERYAVTLGLHARRISIAGVDCRVVNLESVDSVVAAIKEANASVVIHTAAITNVDACEVAPERANHANVVIARNVALACAAQGTKLVHISTDHLFSGQDLMMDEAANLNPVNVYGRTKAEGERAVLGVCPGAIVSRTNFFGWGLPYRQSFSDTILASLRAGHEIGLFQDAFFTPILMNSLIEMVHELIAKDARGIFHMGGDERLSKYEFGLRIARAFDLETDLIKPAFLAERRDLTPRPLDLSLDNRKMRAAIGHGVGDVNSQLARLLALES